MLTKFYLDTGGPDWKNSSSWLQGEPCVDGWHGVSCCPEDKPVLKRQGGEWLCNRDDDSAAAAVSDDADGAPDDGGYSNEPTPLRRWPDGVGTAVYPAGCASGSSTGTVADHARCVVVGIELPSNGLQGSLPTELCDLNLQTFDVVDNGITGKLPPCFAQLGAPAFDHNQLDYVESDPTLRELIERCRTSGDAYCSGVPPLSCGAFGSRFQVRSDDSQRCVKCPDLASSIALQLLALLFFAGLVVGYVRVVGHFQRLGEKLDLWINTAAILFCHLQTVSIIGTLRLAWPASVELLTEIASVDFLSLGAARPECALRFGENSFYFFTLLRITLLLVLVLGISCVQKLVKSRSATKDLQKTVGRVDQLEMVETVLFTFGLTLSWRVIFDLWEQGGSSLSVARAGTGLATILFLVQLQILTKYALNIRALVTGKHLDLELPRGLGARLGLPSGRRPKVAVAKLSHERLQVRLSFLTERFGSHAPYWQFVVWLRQFLLTLDVWIAGLVVNEKDNIKEGQTICIVAYRNATTGEPLPLNEYALLDDPTSYNVSLLPPDATLNATADPYCRPLSDASLSAIWAHVAFALIIFVSFWAAQLRVKPYAHSFQNLIESWLFAANIVLVVLGTAYTSLKINGDLSPGIEVLCVLLLVGSLLSAAAFMCYQSRREHLKRRLDLAGRAELAAGVESGNDSGKLAPFPIGSRALVVHDDDADGGEDHALGGGGGAKKVDMDAPTRGANLRNHLRRPVPAGGPAASSAAALATDDVSPAPSSAAAASRPSPPASPRHATEELIDLLRRSLSVLTTRADGQAHRDRGDRGVDDAPPPSRGRRWLHQAAARLRAASEAAASRVRGMPRPFGSSRVEPPPQDVAGTGEPGGSDPPPPPQPTEAVPLAIGKKRRLSEDLQDKAAQKKSLLAELETLKAENDALRLSGHGSALSGLSVSGSALSGSTASLELSALSPRLPPLKGQLSSSHSAIGAAAPPPLPRASPPPLPSLGSPRATPPPLPSPTSSPLSSPTSRPPLPPLPGQSSASLTSSPLPSPTSRATGRPPLPPLPGRSGATPPPLPGRLVGLSSLRLSTPRSELSTTSSGMSPSPPGSSRGSARDIRRNSLHSDKI